MRHAEPGGYEGIGTWIFRMLGKAWSVGTEHPQSWEMLRLRYASSMQCLFGVQYGGNWFLGSKPGIFVQNDRDIFESVKTGEYIKPGGKNQMRLKKEFMIREVAGQDVIVATGKEAMKYNGLLTVSPVGRFLLDNYQNAQGISDLIQMVLNEFEVDQETAAKDTVGFTNTMLEQGFIEMDDPEKGW